MTVTRRRIAGAMEAIFRSLMITQTSRRLYLTRITPTLVFRAPAPTIRHKDSLRHTDLLLPRLIVLSLFSRELFRGLLRRRLQLHPPTGNYIRLESCQMWLSVVTTSIITLQLLVTHPKMFPSPTGSSKTQWVQLGAKKVTLTLRLLMVMASAASIKTSLTRT